MHSVRPAVKDMVTVNFRVATIVQESCAAVRKPCDGVENAPKRDRLVLCPRACWKSLQFSP